MKTVLVYGDSNVRGSDEKDCRGTRSSSRQGNKGVIQ
jgi:hypothetical protein